MKTIITHTISLFLMLVLSTGHALAQMPVSDWRRQQDSLRNEILERKENNLLKNSFLQELYIRDAVRTHGDSLTIYIPFDLHSLYDCGAPDCYSTDVSLSFKLGCRLEFPHEVQFTEREHGCVKQETYISGTFRLIAQTNDYVIYHSPEHGRTLVLFSKFESVGTCAYYFTNAETDITQNSVTGENVYSIEKKYVEDDPSDQIAPFKSTKLNRMEYEVFADR